MSNLSIFNNDQQFDAEISSITIDSINYDWNLIVDEGDREAVKNEIETYQESFKQNLKYAQQIIIQDTVDKAECLYNIKQRLKHGQFSDICRAMGVNRDQQSSLVSIHQNILKGADNDDILAMVRSMEPRAADKLLKAEPEKQKSLQATFKQTGRVPSRRDFSKPKSNNSDWFKRQQAEKQRLANIEHQLNHAFDDSPVSKYYVPQKPVVPAEKVVSAETAVVDVDTTPNDYSDVRSALTSESVTEAYQLRKLINQQRKAFLSRTPAERKVLGPIFEEINDDIQLILSLKSN